MSDHGSFSSPNTPAPPPLEWSIDTPTKTGWYWSQIRGGRPHVVELVKDFESSRLTVGQTGAYVTDLEPENHRWAGPLVPPQGGMMWAHCP